MVQYISLKSIIEMNEENPTNSFLESINMKLGQNLNKRALTNLIASVFEIIERDDFKKKLKSNYYLLNLLLSYELGLVKISQKYLIHFGILELDNIYTFYYFLTNILKIPSGNQKDKLNVLLEKIHPNKNLNYLLKCFNYSLKEFRQKYIINCKDYVITTKSYFSNFNEKDFFNDITWDFETDFKMLIKKGFINNKVYYEPELNNNYYLNYLTLLLLRCNIKSVLPDYDEDILLEIVLGRSFIDLNVENKATTLYQENNKPILPFGEVEESIEKLSSNKVSLWDFNINKITQDDHSCIFYMKNFRNQDIVFPPELLFKMLKQDKEILLNYFIVNEV